MKITKEQYLKARESLPKLRKAEETVKAWESAVEGEQKEVTSINVTPEGTELTCRKEVGLADGGTGRGAA